MTSEKHMDKDTGHFDTEGFLKRAEFHRNSIALLPSPSEKRPGVAYFIKKEDRSQGEAFCTCTFIKNRECGHILELMKGYNALKKEMGKSDPDDPFRKGIWFKLASVMFDGNNVPLEDICLKKLHGKSGEILQVTDFSKNEMLQYFSLNDDRARFIERCMIMPEHDNEDIVPTRNIILNKLYSHTRTPAEWMMLERGFKTRGQLFEESFWFRMAYHFFRELGNEGFTLSPAINKRSGAFTVTCADSDNNPVFRMNIPGNIVKRLLLSFGDILLNRHGMNIQPVPLKSIFNINKDTQLDLDIRPSVEHLQKDGEQAYLKKEEIKAFRYKDLLYVPELGIITELERPGKERKFRAPVKMVLKKSMIPEFYDESEDELQGEEISSPETKALKIIKEYERVEISPTAIDRDWCWLSIKYHFGDNELSLIDILRAAGDGQRYITSERGWIDAGSPEIVKLTDFFKDAAYEMDGESLRFSRMDLIRLRASSKNLEVSGDSDDSILLKRIMDLKPSGPLPELRGLNSELRGYQKLGWEWLCFLHENTFGGLLCDDMGLGKTHQVMAFLLSLREHRDIKAPFLVVCPTTVLSHWQEKIRMHAPSLKGTIYHGGNRNLKKSLKDGNLILTSYGILTRDIKDLKKIPFSVSVFDEIQHIKNSGTQAYRAAAGIDSSVKIGLTGTPIENRIEELKALFDLAVPGYLGSDAFFKKQYVHPIEDLGDNRKKDELSNIISPFVLRRMKNTVLDELPEKIEDILSCSLTEDQVKLYRDAVKFRGEGLLESLKRENEPVPYIHIFALLNLLKQICNHPALVEKVPEEYEKYKSGKWELFKEILMESVDSGQKVVVYSQYLGMIEIIKRFLKKSGIDFAALTGASRNRGDIIKRFSSDSNCRVFLGSLKAGGVGIDLIAASVVIHYDRWWNAAKEDQATDRVHRIGQKRGVQVFKLVTRGTLEEKISAIIQKKKNLMNSVVKEDDPGLLKSFSREELIDLLDFENRPDTV